MLIPPYYYGDINMKAQDVEILQALLENREKNMNMNTVATLIKKDYKTVHTIIQRLSELDIIELTPFGKSYTIKLHYHAHPLFFEAEYQRRKVLLKNKDFSVLLDTFQKLSSSFYTLLVFGSYAKKRASKHSDIDLLFILPDSSEEDLTKEIHALCETLPLPLHVHIFSETAFKSMRDSKKATIGSEAIQNNILLTGIEPYYELIS